jgi:hypothetical protein
MEETKWLGWRRRRGSRDPWEKVDKTLSVSKAACLQALVEDGELTRQPGLLVLWEYNVLPEGQTPPTHQPLHFGKDSARYKDRMARSERGGIRF